MKRNNNSLQSYPPLTFIESELKRAGLAISHTGDHLQIPCPFHRETKPSLSVSLGTGKIPCGVFHCFGCGEKGRWNKLAHRLGLSSWGSAEEDGIYIAKTKAAIQKEISEDDFALSKWRDNWKRYNSEFLSIFGARKMRDCLNHVDYLWIPIEYGGDLYGYCRARLHETDPGPKYFFNANLVKVLYPFDLLLEMDCTTIVLVEGIADAYRLINQGIPALALLGVNLLPIMEEQLALLDVKNVIICLDGDAAGRTAVRGRKVIDNEKTKDKRKPVYKRKPGLRKKLKDLGYNVLWYRLPEDTDPDDVPFKYVKKLKRIFLDTGGVLFNVYDYKK